MAKIVKLENSTNDTTKKGKRGANSFLYMGILGVAGILFGTIGFFLWRENRRYNQEIVAQEMLWPAQRYLEEKKYREALHGDDITPGFLAIMEKYPDTKAAKLAAIYHAIIHMEERDYKAAIAQLAAIHVKEPITQAFVYGLQGDAHSQMKAYQKAVNAYQKAFDATSNKEVRARYLSKIAAVEMHRGNSVAAEKCYQRICTEFPDTATIDTNKKMLGLVRAIQEPSNKE